MAHLEDELRRDIAEGQVTCIVGAGVSIAAAFDPDRKPNFASWQGLLEHGVDRCLQLSRALPDWGGRVRAEIASGDTDDLLSAAEKVSRKLGAPEDGEFRRWLRETVGALRIRYPRVPVALKALGAPLLTTNYDEILEEATGLPALTWREHAEVERALRGEDRAIIHLHGYWRRPESVILGIRSYEGVLRDEHAQTVQRALRATKTLLFGLFTGAAWLRFAHLTLGEYLAASADLDLDSELARFRVTERVSMEVLPMALALRGAPALETVLRAAEERDTWDHRLLGLVLRAAALGGTSPSGTRVWVRFARVLGQVQSEWSTPVLVTTP